MPRSTYQDKIDCMFSHTIFVLFFGNYCLIDINFFCENGKRECMKLSQRRVGRTWEKLEGEYAQNILCENFK